MAQVSPIREKSYAFAVIIVQICQQLQEKKEFVMSTQLLKSGTSIGANVEEAQDAQSKPDFISKCSIALKEARETQYWIRLLVDTNYLPSTQSNLLFDDLRQIIALLVAIIKTARKG